MSTVPLDATEREQLCDLFLELGPEAPTLCEGWAALDLAAHLVIRERDPRGGLVILGGARFSGLEDKLMGRAKDRGLDALVATLRKGPPPVPWRLPGLRPLLNLNEWFVHHEDVRRANGQPPRTDVAGLEEALWGTLGGGAGRLMVRSLGDVGLTIAAPDRGEKVLRKGTPTATLTGAPQELALYLNGRRTHAEVTLTGDPTATQSLTTTNLGV